MEISRLDRRTFLTAALVGAASSAAGSPAQKLTAQELAALEKKRVLGAADLYVKGGRPETVTASSSPRSAGGKHDFFSEGDYWWPDPKDPKAPYVQRDGMTNPDNFVEHRKALMKFSVQMPALTAAAKISGKKNYGNKAVEFLRAWFVDAETRMNPNLQFAQAISGRYTGRGTGIIDTIHLVEVAQAVPFLESSGALSKADAAAVRKWFSDYTAWMMNSDNGKQERDTKNNHATCWTMQVAAFAKLTGDQTTLEFTKDRFTKIHIPGQQAADGSFPLEMARTKPYGYSLFNLEAMSTLAQLHSLWHFTLPDGRGMEKAVAFMAPFIADKNSWPKKPDVMYYEQWPMRQSALLFGGLALGHEDWIALWKKLPADSTVDEVIRNFFIRQPVLWV